MVDKKKLAGLIGIGLIGIGIGGVGMSAYNSAHPYTITEQKITFVDVPFEVVKEVPVEVIKEVVTTVEVPVETIVEIPVDNGNLQSVLEHIYDNDGNINYLTDDLDDDEIDEIVDRIMFVNDIKQLAIDEVKKEGIDLLDKEMVNDTELDDKDVERFKLYDDAEDITVDDIDFDDGDADVYVNTRFEQDDVKYIATYKVQFKDSKVDDIDLDSVALKD